MKQFMCYWGGGYPEGIKLKVASWFDEDRGYSPGMIEDVMLLEVGESMIIEMGDHIITRVG